MITLILMRYVAFTTFCLKSFELPFPLFRNGKTSIWSGTSRITGRLKTSEFPPNISGNRIFSCITGCSEAFYFTLMPYFCQRWWGFWRDVSHKRDCNQRGDVHLHPSWHLQVHLQDRHHLVPLWRPGLRHEVRELDLRRVQGRPQAEGRGRGPGHVHQQWGVGSSKWETLFQRNSCNCCCRRTSNQKQGDIRVLPRSLPRRDVHDQDPEANPLLFLQPDRPLRPHRLHGCARLHLAARLGGEALLRWAATSCTWFKESSCWKLCFKKLLSRVNDLRMDRLQAGRSIQNATKDPLFILKATHLDCFRRDNSPFADGVSQHGCWNNASHLWQSFVR